MGRGKEWEARMSEKQLMARGGKAKVLLVDDHPLVRRGMAATINAEADLTVCGSAESAEQALELIPKAEPSIALIDITLGGLDGIDLIKDIRSRYPNLLMLVVSMHDECTYADRALRAGARGYIMKSEPVERVLAATRRVLGGEVYVSERCASHLLGSVVGGGKGMEKSPLDRLTDRELQVFTFLGQGLGIREIADRLYLSTKTVEAHREHIKQKFNFQRSQELLRYAIQHVAADA